MTNAAIRVAVLPAAGHPTSAFLSVFRSRVPHHRRRIAAENDSSSPTAK